MKRHRDALGIQEGARNVRAIARSLVEATDEAAREGIGAEQDAAVRMIVHQLARICKVQEIDNDFDPTTLRDVYCILMEECEQRAKEAAVADAVPTEVTVVVPEAAVMHPHPAKMTSIDLQEPLEHTSSSTSTSTGASRPV